MKFVTSFGFRAGLVTASHLFALISVIAGGEWLALVWLIVASLWAVVAFMYESQVDRQRLLIDGLAKIAKAERRVS